MGLFFWATPRAPFQAAHHRVLNAGSARSLLLYRFEPVAVDLLPARRFARAPPARHPDAPLAAARVALRNPPTHTHRDPIRTPSRTSAPKMIRSNNTKHSHRPTAGEGGGGGESLERARWSTSCVCVRVKEGARAQRRLADVPRCQSGERAVCSRQSAR
jgi:hypothetical protein